MAPPGMEEMTDQLQGMFKNLSNTKTKTQKMKMICSEIVNCTKQGSGSKS